MVNNTDKQQNKTKVEDLIRVKGICQYANPPKMGSTGNYQPAHLILVDGDKRHDVQDFPITTEGEFTFRIFPSPLEDCRNRYFEFMVAPDAKTPSYESKSGTTHKWMAKNLINDPFEQGEDAIEDAIESPEQPSAPKPVAKLTFDEIRSMQIAWNSAINNAVTANPIKDWVVTEATEDQPRLFDVEHLEKWMQEIDLLASAIYPLIRRGAENPSEVQDDDVIETLSAEDE
tara:strand:- start:1765 stop:2454 length:690 start_codon:yes stop_codon:yes gene_type:complete